MENKKIAIYGIIVATYTAISILLGSFSFGMVQIRVAELLLVLCLYSKKFILPVTLGCFVTNFIGIINGFNPLVIDIVVGTLATLLSAYCVYYFRSIKLFNLPLISLLLPALINGVMIGIELAFYFPMNILYLIFYVGIGEFISVTILGLLLYKPIGKAIEPYVEWYNCCMNIDINKLGDIKLELDQMKENDTLYIEENGEVKYAIMHVSRYDRADELLDIFDNNSSSQVKIIGSNEELSYEEYEKIKALIMDAVEKTFRPKAEKLN